MLDVLEGVSGMSGDARRPPSKRRGTSTQQPVKASPDSRIDPRAFRPATDTGEIAVSATTFTSNPVEVTQAVEVFSRASAGLALDNIGVTISIHPVDDDDEDD